MIQDLYRKYDEQRDAAGEADRKLKDEIRTNHRYLQQIHSPEGAAIARLALGKVAFEQGRLASAADRPTFLSQADEHLSAALHFYDSEEVREVKRTELADCLILAARIKTAQGALPAADNDLWRSLKILNVPFASYRGDLRDSLLAAFAELTESYLRNGQLVDRLDDLYNWA